MLALSPNPTCYISLVNGFLEIHISSSDYIILILLYVQHTHFSPLICLLLPFKSGIGVAPYWFLIAFHSPSFLSNHRQCSHNCTWKYPKYLRLFSTKQNSVEAVGCPPQCPSTKQTLYLSWAMYQSAWTTTITEYPDWVASNTEINFLTVLEDRSPRLKRQQEWYLVKPLLLGCTWLVPSHDLSFVLT